MHWSHTTLRVSAFHRCTKQLGPSCHTSMKPILILLDSTLARSLSVPISRRECLSLCKDERSRSQPRRSRCQPSSPASPTIDSDKIKVNHILHSQNKGRYLFFEEVEPQMAAYAWDRFAPGNCLPVDSLQLPCKRTSAAHQTSHE
jgi:hypothetical protein